MYALIFKQTLKIRKTSKYKNVTREIKKTRGSKLDLESDIIAISKTSERLLIRNRLELS